MAYNKEELEQEAVKIAKTKKCVFINEVAAFMPCSKSTFYNHELEKLDSIKDVLWKNRTEMSYTQNRKWYLSDNATLQISLRKLIGTDEDRRRLSQSWQDITTDGEKINRNVDLSILSIEELHILKKLHERSATPTADTSD